MDTSINDLLTNLTNDYQWLMSKGDKRIDHLPLVKSPLPTITICILYIIFVKYIGPEWMKNKKPYDLRNIIIIYNCLMVIVNSYIFIMAGIYGWFGKYNFLCQPMDYSYSKDAVGMANISWLFFITKFIDLADTIFFVLRKKFSHITTLHVIHHSIMPAILWTGIKFVPGGHGSFSGFLNSGVHVIMYSYYALSALGPKIQPYLWWKKYLTVIQMIQFIIIFLHSMLLLKSNCDFPRFYAYELITIASLFFALFGNFFYSSYIKKNKNSSKSQ